MTTSSAVPGALAALGDTSFVSLTTFRRTGAPVSTPVWVARDGDVLVVTTPVDSGKVKRLRHTPRVELRPCSRTGTVAEGAPTVVGHAEVLTDPAAMERPTALLRDKYGWEYRVMMLVERVAARRQRQRAIVRITVPDASS
ncbi:PPOX class F420-dependent oxidoreductase [uncultured Cellulomonas sp.]|uniref:PPOX class F420-dependent oxidoreductase n=1 Tax=uncultured Cellulomonas sp. TaxID=189682 RepID=UPI002627F2EC|nr:PPOX class F420-dependent oxidoreductase [uncultured Cellulomonas sp.]